MRQRVAAEPAAVAKSWTCPFKAVFVLYRNIKISPNAVTCPILRIRDIPLK
jgi:hypothetical protein